MRISTRRMSALALAAMTALSLGACGDDAGDEQAGDTDTTEAAAETVEVTMVDYGYQGLPESVPAGTKFTVTNASTAEAHEFVAMRIPDEEKRPVSEIAALPEEEAGKIFAGGEPATVLVAPPGGEMVQAVGDGTISEPGRYAIACFVPLGADPQEFMAQGGPPEGEEGGAPGGEGGEGGEGGPPDVEGGPPHITKGMYAELTVTEA